MSKTARNVSAIVGLLVLTYAGGFFSASLVSPAATESSDDHAPEAAHAHDDHQDEEVVELTEQAVANLGLRMGRVSRQDYRKSRTIPGEVVEIPGQTTMTISAPVTGVIESVLARPGESVDATARLFSLRITDEFLTNSQSKLLAGMARGEIIQKELERLEPLTSSGAIVGRRKRELEYELTQLESSQTVLRQEMTSRGLPEWLLDGVVNGQTLARLLPVTPSPAANPPIVVDKGSIRPVSLQTTTPASYTMGDVLVRPGQSVERGEKMCDVHDHSELYVRGQAFDSDLRLLHQLTQRGWGITAEFGHDHLEGATETVVRADLPLLRIENVVNPNTQTFYFYVPLQNELVEVLRDDQQRAFRQWQFRPGQRVHLKVPVDEWKDQIVLPLAAVMIEGPNVSVFVEHEHEEDDHDHDDHDDHEHSAEESSHHHEEGMLVLEPIAVRLLHRDEQVAVIADDGQLTEDHLIALNAAYELHQAMNIQTDGGGGGHHHDH